ncbi:MAG TPA: hypothetical protein PKK94_00605 [Leptospiraceae bacterium]|nr:hypothetical protein [Leptospiraceae bacterium]
MKIFLPVLLLIFMHCSEKESKHKEDSDSNYKDPSKLPYMLSGEELKYNDNIYYSKYYPEGDMPTQIRNYEKEIQVFLPFAEEFRKDLLKNDPKEIIKHFSSDRKRKILKYLNEEYCLSYRLNELSSDRLFELYGQGKLGLKRTIDYFYSGLIERKAPLVLDIIFYKWTKEEIYTVMIAPDDGGHPPLPFKSECSEAETRSRGL